MDVTTCQRSSTYYETRKDGRLRKHHCLRGTQGIIDDVDSQGQSAEDKGGANLSTEQEPLTRVPRYARFSPSDTSGTYDDGSSSDSPRPGLEQIPRVPLSANASYKARLSRVPVHPQWTKLWILIEV